MSEAELREQVLALVSQMGSVEEEVFDLLYPAAVSLLRERLRPDVDYLTDCGAVFPLAAARLLLELAEGNLTSGGQESFTAGSVTISSGGSTAQSWDATLQLLKPWLADEGFAFLGVRG